MASEAIQVGSIFYDVQLNSQGVATGATQITGWLDKLKAGFNNLDPTVRSLGISLGVYFSARAMIDFFKGTVDAANESNRVIAQTNAVLTSTGGVAGYTTDEIIKMGYAFQQVTTVSHDTAQAGMNVLLSFTKIGHDTFPQASKALLDMAFAMNQGVTPSAEQLGSTALQLGKWLQNPILGMTSAARLGIVFSASQKALAKQLMETGQQAKAQALILEVLNQKFGGSAAAQAGTFAGQMEMLNNKFIDFKEDVGYAIIPMLSYLVSGINNTGSAFTVLVDIAKVVSSAFLALSFMGRQLGTILSGVGAMMIALFTGDFRSIGSIWKVTIQDMVQNSLDLAQKSTQIWKGETNKQVGITQAGAQQEEAAADKKAAKVKKDLADETEAYNDALAKRNKTFDESMADLIWAHQDKVKSLETDLTKENADFDTKMKNQVKTFKESMDQMTADHKATIDGYTADLADETKSHQDKTEAIQTLLDQELSYGKNARQSKITEYKQELADEQTAYDQKVTDTQAQIDKENAAYDTKVAKAKADNDQQTLDLQTAHQAQVADFTLQITTEQGILNAHQTEVNAIKDKARVDDIQRLINQHADENAEALKQHNKKMADIVANSTAEATAGGDAFNSVMADSMAKNKIAMDTATKDIAKTVTENMSIGFQDAGKTAVNGFINGVVNAAKAAWNYLSTKGALGLGGIGSVFSGLDVLKNLPTFATGIHDFSGGLALVGERGPELVNLPRGTDIYSDKDTRGIGQNIYVTIEKVENSQDIDMLVREIGFRINQQPV